MIVIISHTIRPLIYQAGWAHTATGRLKHQARCVNEKIMETSEKKLPAIFKKYCFMELLALFLL